MDADENTEGSPEEPASQDKQAWDELAATLRALDLLDPRTPVERARDAIRKGAEMLRQHGEPEEADKVIAVVGSGRQPGAPRRYTEDDDLRMVLDIHSIAEKQRRPSLNASAKELAETEPYKSRGQSAGAICERYREYFRRLWKDAPADERPLKKPQASQIIKAVWLRAKTSEVEGNSSN
jgi:hypothetical protein